MTEKIMRDILKLLVDELVERTGYARSTISRQIHGKTTFLDDFFASKVTPTGRTVSTQIYNYFGMIETLRTMWPEDAPWPFDNDIMRKKLALLVQEFIRPPGKKKPVEKRAP